MKRSLPNFPHYEDLVAELGFDPLAGREPETDEITALPKRDTKEIPVEPQTDTIRVITGATPSPPPGGPPVHHIGDRGSPPGGRARRAAG